MLHRTELIRSLRRHDKRGGSASELSVVCGSATAPDQKALGSIVMPSPWPAAIRSKTGFARDASIEVWSAPPRQPSVLTPTRCWPSSRKSLICSLGRRSATSVPSICRRAAHAMALVPLSRVTTTSAKPSTGRVNSGAWIRAAEIGFAAELGTGVVPQALARVAAATSPVSRMDQGYCHPARYRNATKSYVLSGSALRYTAYRCDSDSKIANRVFNSLSQYADSRFPRDTGMVVPRRGLEPPRLSALRPEPSASTNSATWAQVAAGATPAEGASIYAGTRFMSICSVP